MNSLWVRRYLRDLVEAAFPLDKAKEKLNSLQDPISEHLFKVFFKPHDPSANHWRAELKAWSGSLILYNNVKTKSGKAFSQKLLNDVLWDEPFGTDADLETLAVVYEVAEGVVFAQKAEFRAFVKTYIEAILTKRPWVAR